MEANVKSNVRSPASAVAMEENAKSAKVIAVNLFMVIPYVFVCVLLKLSAECVEPLALIVCHPFVKFFFGQTRTADAPQPSHNVE